MGRVKFVLILFALATLAVPGNGAPLFVPDPEQSASPAYVPGEVIVKFTSAAQPLDRAAARAGLDATEVVEFQSGARHWRLGPGVDVATAIQRLQANPNVHYAEPNYYWTLNLVPNDPRLPELWGMINTGQTGGTADADIDADMAWSVSTGSPQVVVGVIDTGVDYNHPELAANIWTNPNEIAGNGIDDDANGYIDDIRGWDFYNNDNDPFDDRGHGTHVSGTIAAIGDNGIGVAGVAWNVKIMPLKFIGSGGYGTTTGAILAVQYATAAGADLTSNSWGGGDFSQALYDAIAAAGAANQAFVAAAGNTASDNDIAPLYPSSYDLPNIISVAATDHNDLKAWFSCYGAVTVDLGAPGDDIVSTLPGNSYGVKSGTSMATPHVSGVAALIRTVAPDVPVSGLKNILLASADKIPSMEGITVSGGRLNAFFAIAEPDDVPPGGISDLAAGTPFSSGMGLTWTATGDDGTTGTADRYEVRYSTSPIDDASWASAAKAARPPTPLEPGTPQSMEVAGLTAGTAYYFAIKAFDEWGNAGPLSNIPTGTTLPPPTADVAPTSVHSALFTGSTSDHVVTLSNVGLGTLDFTIPTPALGEVMAVQETVVYGKDELDPRSGDPIVEGSGGPDTFGYRWVDSDEPGGPTFNWVDISTTGTPVGATSDDSISPAIPLGFDMPFYGQFFNAIRVSSNGWLSFTSSATSPSNQPLPSTGSPDNLVAPFWDDLNPGGVNRIFFQSFGTHAIVQWHEIPHYSTTTPGTYTFQAILDFDGTVTYQYLTLVGEVGSNTVGIQDSTRTIGLQVAYNQAYLHNSLAVRIRAMPPWLSASPASGRLWAGQATPIDVHVDAAKLEGGTYPGQVNILTNDPAHPVLTVDVTLDVTGVPDAEATPDALAYGDRYLGLPHELSLTVRNAGTDTLVVSGVSTSHGELVATPASFSLAPREAQAVTVTWTPTVLGPFEGSVTVTSNDASEPAVAVPVAGNAVPAPTILVSPTSFSETLHQGEVVTRSLRVANRGVSDLIVDAATFLGEDGLVVADDEGTTASGGPDAFLYRWKDSDDPDGPVFNWYDIMSVGTQITFGSDDDSLSSAIDMGMTFPYYGNNFTGLKVSTNGWLTFNTTYTGTHPYNYSLPSTGGAPNMIAPFWDDLDLLPYGTVHYYNAGDRFIVQYSYVGQSDAWSSLLTFQVQLFPSGKILLQYKTMTGTLNSATIGMQNATENIGLRMCYNVAYVHNDMAILISPRPDWLIVTPNHAVVPPGGSFDFSVAFDATDRGVGVLEGAVVLLTNIPDEPEVQVPAWLTVIGIPDVAVIPEFYDFGTRYSGHPHLTTFQVVNEGANVLEVSLVDTTDATLLVFDDAAPGGETPQAVFTLPPGSARLFGLQWLPMVPAALNAEVRIHSDDPDEPVLPMPVTGVAIPPPVAVWSPPSFSENLMVGDVVTRTLHLENQGGSDLDFFAQLRDTTAAEVTVYPEIHLADDEEDPREGILGSGGPDYFGYRWTDSDEVGGPRYAWVDITPVGTRIDFGYWTRGTNNGPFPIGFEFPFYGKTFTSFRACSNGFISFTDTTSDSINDPLPSIGAPENLLAVFWDAMLHDDRYGSSVYYYFDGTKTIVQYNNILKYGYYTAPFYTFQVILYPNGDIVYQYQSLGAAAQLNSHTIGIQNAAKDDGLTAVFNDATYVHTGLAVRFRPGNWLKVTPLSGTVPAGGAIDLDVVVDTTGIIGGDYAASIDLATNDPAVGLIAVPVSLHATGIPDIDAVPASLTFPTTFVGFSSTLSVTLQNIGSDVLHISGVSISGDFAQSGLAAPVDLPVNGSIPLTVTFAPTTDGTRLGILSIYSDDPDEPVLAMPFTGVAIPPPVAVWSPPSFSENLMVGDVVTRTLHLENQGGSDLDFFAQLRDTTAAEVTVYPEIHLADGVEDPREGILGRGGPDEFGYKWTDSDEVGGPVYQWVDITPVGTRIDFDPFTSGQNLGPFPIGFEFPFYGKTFTSFHACSNGWISFTDRTSDGLNDPLPSAGAPENLLAVFWDLILYDEGLGSSVYYYFDGTKTIVQYNNLLKYPYCTAPFYTFQVILYPNGKIVYQYQSLGAQLNSHTIGIQNAARDDGLTAVFNDAAYVHTGLAIRFSPLNWLKVTPLSGTVPAGGAIDLDVVVDTTDLIGGDYAASIDLATNDPAVGLIAVPVTLHTTGIPDIGAVPASLTFPTTFVGFSSTLPVTLRNIGTDVLHISGVSISGDFAQSGLAAPVDLPVNGSIPLTVTFAPTTDGTRLGILSIYSDDPDEPTFEIALEGYGLFPPEIGSAPEAISTALPPGGTRTKTLTLLNTGGSDLNWTVSLNSFPGAGSVEVYDYLELDEDEEDPRVGILGSGGPDLFGYKWKDSDEPGGPVFDWVDISGVGTPIVFDPTGDRNDGNVGPFPIGFAFPFYGNNFTFFRACTNGWVSFTSTKTAYSNQPLPNAGTAVPENLLAVFWDDLYFRGASSVPRPSKAYYHFDGTRLIIQYNHMYRNTYWWTDDINFQVILYPSGKIVYQYQTMSVSDPKSHTIGIQNATKTDGLTVAYNIAYVHSNMAVEFSELPEWIRLDTLSGTIPAGGSQDLTVTLDAADLEIGIHEATLDFLSNDPYTPFYLVPITLNVGVVNATWADFNPGVLNLTSDGTYVIFKVELPPDLDPYQIDPASVRLNGVIPVRDFPAPNWQDQDGNGIIDVDFKFDRAALEALLPVGAEVPVWITGEVRDVQWWRGDDTIRTLNPRIKAPEHANYCLLDTVVRIQWDGPVSGTATHYAVQLSRDGGVTWRWLADNVAGLGYDWVASGATTENALVRVFAFDQQGLMGFDISDGPFTIAGPALLPPNPVPDLTLVREGTDLTIAWKASLADLGHGPVESYRVLRSESGAGPFVEVATVTEPAYREALAATEGVPLVLYHVVAVNAAGESD